jgi:transcriptional regulator with XRE-family HTH domain
MKQPALGKKILELRKQKGFTQEELVEQCNINVRTIQRIEAGEVSPRSYTIKTILEVLGFNYDEIFQESYVSGKFDKFLGINKDKIYKQLNLAVIFGIIYFVIGFIEIATEYYRVTDNRFLLENSVYILVKFISILSFTFFIRGFIIVGNIYKNYFLEIIAIIVLITYFLFGVYDVFSLFFLKEIIEFSILVRIISFGVLIVLLGVGMIKLKEKLGNLPLVVGILEIIAGIFLIFFLVELGVAIIFPLQLLEIILLYKIIKIKS